MKFINNVVNVQHFHYHNFQKLFNFIRDNQTLFVFTKTMGKKKENFCEVRLIKDSLYVNVQVKKLV